MKPWSVALGTVLVALVLVVSGCSGGGRDDGPDPEPKALQPGEVAMLYVDAFRGGDELVGYNARSGWDGSFFDSVGGSAEEVVGEPLDAQQRARVAEAFRKALGQVRAKVVAEKVDGDAATVTLRVRGLAYGAALDRAGKDFTLDTKDPSGSYTALLLEALGLAKPVKEPVRVKVKLDRDEDGVWTPNPKSGAALTRALMR